MDKCTENSSAPTKRFQLQINKIHQHQDSHPYSDSLLASLTSRVGKTPRGINLIFESKKTKIFQKNTKQHPIRRSKSDSYLLFANEYYNKNISLTPLPELPAKFQTKMQNSSSKSSQIKPSLKSRKSHLRIGIERKNKWNSPQPAQETSVSRDSRQSRYSLSLPRPLSGLCNDEILLETKSVTNTLNIQATTTTTENNRNIPMTTENNCNIQNIPKVEYGSYSNNWCVPPDVPIPPPIAENELSTTLTSSLSSTSQLLPPPPALPPLPGSLSSLPSSLKTTQKSTTLSSFSLLSTSLKPSVTTTNVKINRKKKRNTEKRTSHRHFSSPENRDSETTLLSFSLLQQRTPIPLPNDLIFDPETKELVAAPVSSFITYVLLNSLQDSTLLKYFLLTHLHFMSSEELLTTLIKFYEDSQKFDKKEDTYLIQIRVLNIIKKWFQYGMQDFAHNRALGAILNQFIAKLEKGEESNNAFASLLKSAMATLYGQTLGKNLNAAPVPLLSRKVKELIKESSKNDGKLRKGTLTVTDIPAVELARQLTLLDFQLLTKVRPSELLNNRFTREETSPNIAALAKRFQKVSQWIATEIVTASVARRAKVISHFIHVAECLLQLQNFHSAMSFVTGLSHFIVSRFDKAWKEIGKDMATKFKELEQIFLPTGNWKNLRPIYEKAKPPMIPPSPIILKDLMFIEEGNADHWNNDPHLLNINKLQFLGKVVSKLQSCQETPYQFFPIALIQQFLDDLYILNDTELKKSAMSEL